MSVRDFGFSGFCENAEKSTSFFSGNLSTPKSAVYTVSRDLSSVKNPPPSFRRIFQLKNLTSIQILEILRMSSFLQVKNSPPSFRRNFQLKNLTSPQIPELYLQYPVEADQMLDSRRWFLSVFQVGWFRKTRILI
jgi:hypothetical protein